MSNVFFTADLHLGHQKIIQLSERPFRDVEEMSEQLITRWNAMVKPKDMVYVLGDFAMGQIDKTLPLVKRLHGRKCLILGNHDRPFMRADKPDEAEWLDRYQEAGFLGIAHTLSLHIADRDVLLNHFPYHGDSHEQDRYLDRRPPDEGKWLLHGHAHGRRRVDRAGHMIDVGVDAWDYYPVPLETIEFLIRDTERS